MFTIFRVDYNADRDAMTAEREALAGTADVRLLSAVCACPQDIVAQCADADVLITHSAAVTREVFAALPRLRAVIRYGVGYDTVDVNAATKYGVMVVNVPDFCTEEVTNHVILFLLAAAKKLIPLNALVRAGRWDEAKALRAPMGAIHGETLGIIGCGNLGRAVARKAQAFGMEVIGYDRFTPEALTAEAGIHRMELDEVAARADYLTVHVAQTPETRHMVDARLLALMKPSAVLINCARGSVVDEAALTDALRSGRLAGACLDVFEKEPTGAENPLFALKNVLATPHDASYSDAAFLRLKRSVIEEALRIKNGERPLHVVNHGVLPKQAQ